MPTFNIQNKRHLLLSFGNPLYHLPLTVIRNLTRNWYGAPYTKDWYGALHQQGIDTVLPTPIRVDTVGIVITTIDDIFLTKTESHNEAQNTTLISWNW